jgi:hypothetical protein
MRTIERPIRRCPEPACGGQILIEYLWRDKGAGLERHHACSLCGREPAAGRRPPDRATGRPSPDRGKA